MNTVKFYRVHRGKLECATVKVVQGPNARGVSVAQAEDRMVRAGWSRKKPDKQLRAMLAGG